MQEFYFAIYAGIGRDRSLNAVHDLVSGMGIGVSLKTLERYSRTYSWKQRVQEYDIGQAKKVSESVLRDAIANNVQHARIGRALAQLAMRGITERLPSPTNPNGATGLRGSEIARLASEGVRIERLASGQATDVHAVVVGLTEAITDDIASLWQTSLSTAIDIIATSTPVADEVKEHAFAEASMMFGRGVDRMLNDRIKSAGFTDVVVGSDPSGEVEEE